jgi:SAM-dependent methyltransferase
MDEALLLPLLLLILSTFGLSWFAGSDAPYVPTKTRSLNKILKAGGVKKGSIFYELGSGDGRVVIEAARLGAEGNGVEQSWIRVWYSRLKAKDLNLNNTHFFHGNIFDRHYFPADVVYIYMLQNCVDRLEETLKKELKKGAIVITQTYHFKKWQPYKKIDSFWYYRA